MKALEITPAIVRQAEETEAQLVSVCRELVEKIDDCKWQVGVWFTTGRDDSRRGGLMPISGCWLA